MDLPSPHLYRAEALRRNIPSVVVDNALAQIVRNNRRGTGAILSLSHLARLSGASFVYLRRIVQRRYDPYEDLPVRKKSGTLRPIVSPEPVLMDVQRLILRRALRNLELHPRSFAYREGLSVLDCARVHVGARWLVKLDLSNFFGSISERSVYTVFRAQGYSSLVSLELARLCTRAPAGVYYRDPLARDRYWAIGSYAGVPPGLLPQGAPTSGALANAVATELDSELWELGHSFGLSYTRYSDDLTFSTSSDFSRSRAKAFIKEARGIVKDHSFKLQESKTRVIPPGARHVVLGLLVDDERVRLLPEYRRRLDVHIRGVRNFGLANHVKHRGFNSVLSFVNHVDGSLAFAAHIDSSWADDARRRWSAALQGHGFPL